MIANRTRHLLPAMLTAALLAPGAIAENVDLSTIPQRDTVQLTIYNSEDLTLVRETRHITFFKGVNPLQFSWANTLIDPSSVDLRFKTHADELDVLDTTFPHDKPQMLYWNVDSELDGDAVVEITYFTSGITWAADYVCISDLDEEEMSFEGFVKITNNSGEDYASAQVRLVVGQINLVEKIADLARRGIIAAEERDAYAAGRMKVAEFEAPARRELQDELRAGVAAAPPAPKQIVKEGLSEYFIYTIDGTETIENSWSKRMRLFQGGKVPFEIEYRYRPAEYGDRLVRLYILRNDEESKLGTTPLPDGVVRVFRDNGRDGLSFLTAYQTKYVPIGQEIELNLGPDPRVIHQRIRLASRRDNFWFRDRNNRRYFSPTRGERIDPNYTVAGWDAHHEWIERIRNYTGDPIAVEIRRVHRGHIIITSDLDMTLHDYQTPEINATIDAQAKRDLAYAVTIKHGVNKKQDNVTLKRPE
ncbi:MAG: hypothetical protein SYC29_05890 [Planctomycetota bacterium]|nr:hypothetical protein [Planctomycetota bacterium]